MRFCHTRVHSLGAATASSSAQAPLISRSRASQSICSSRRGVVSRSAAGVESRTKEKSKADTLGLQDVDTLFSSAGIADREVSSFPIDFAGALHDGKVSPEQLHRYLEMESHFLYRFVWGWQGLRERLLADPGFTAKMSIEVGIGICTKLTAESTKRAEDFMREIDFVAANVVMAIIADWMLTWLPAPTLSFGKSKGSSNPVEKFFAGCPDNAFQKVPPGMAPFTVGQRSKAILRNGLKLLAVGFGSSLFGVGLTNSLVMLRFFLDPSWSGPPNDPQNVVATSLAYGVYMAVSSNLRYQIIAGVIEERGIEVFFAGNPRACTILSFFTRTSNTFLGSLLWVDFIRVLGMQKSRQVVPVEAASSLAFDIAELPAMCEDASNGMWQGMQDSLVAHPQIAGNVQGLVESHLACAVDPSSLGM